MSSGRELGYEGERPDVQALVPRDARRILELGCSNGSLGAALKARQEVEVVGVEYDPGYGSQAARVLDRVIVGDAEAVLASGELSGEFDALVCADVLEHLRDPWTALSRGVSLVRPGGAVVVSLPNVRYARVLVEVFVKGRWPREDWGTFDRTHLRWFTRADAVELLEQAGLRVERVQPQEWIPPGAMGVAARVLARTPLRFLTHGQYVLLGRRA